MALPSKSDLQKLDLASNGAPFADIEAKSGLATNTLNTAYMGAPFVGASPAASGSLSLTVTQTHASVNLTTLGYDDWAFWTASSTSGVPGVRKSGGGSLIGTATPYGAGGFDGYGNEPVQISWSDGTPTASSTNNTEGIYNTANDGGSGSTNFGFNVPFPADTTPRIARVYFGAWNTKLRVVASLSDGSAASQTDIGTIDNNYGYAEIQYKAGSPGATMTLRFSVETSYIAQGNTALNAALVKIDTSTTGSITTTEGNDTASVSAAVRNNGSITATEGNDTASITAAWRNNGAITATEGNDTASVAASVRNVASITSTEGNDTASITASVAGITGAVITATEANDVGSVTAAINLPASGVITTTDGNDTTSFVVVVGQSSRTDVGGGYNPHYHGQWDRREEPEDEVQVDEEAVIEPVPASPVITVEADESTVDSLVDALTPKVEVKPDPDLIALRENLRLLQLERLRAEEEAAAMLFMRVAVQRRRSFLRR